MYEKNGKFTLIYCKLNIKDSLEAENIQYTRFMMLKGFILYAFLRARLSRFYKVLFFLFPFFISYVFEIVC